MLLVTLLAAFLVPSAIYVMVAQRPQPKTVGWVWFVVHASLVGILAIDMLFQVRHSGEAVMGWLLVDLLDFPASLLHLGLESLLIGTRFSTFWVVNYTLPLTGGLIFGSIQWGLIGWGLATVSRKMAENLE